MTLLRPRLCQLSLSAFLIAGIVMPIYPAIAKPKPKPTSTVDQVTTQIVENSSETRVWDNIINKIANNYRDIPTNFMDSLRGSFDFRDELLDLFWGQDGDRQALEEILLEIVLGEDDYAGTETTDYSYTVNRNCLPPGQQQRLDSGKPIPPGILKKCGRIESFNN